MFFNNLLNKLINPSLDKSWIEQLKPIIKDFKNGNNDPLTPQEVERLTLLIRLKIDIEEGNISNEDLEYTSQNRPTFH
jgi:hypothetical protein|tara:strand:- start:107 stop:340 length:234 start_codon:yes stop_codon:yes gene_type:complete